MSPLSFLFKGKANSAINFKIKVPESKGGEWSQIQILHQFIFIIKKYCAENQSSLYNNAKFLLRLQSPKIGILAEQLFYCEAVAVTKELKLKILCSFHKTIGVVMDIKKGVVNKKIMMYETVHINMAEQLSINI